MSSLWTPGGEHPVDRSPSGDAAAAASANAGGPVDDADPLSPEEQSRLAEAAEEMARVREQLANAPAELVIANHIMGLYELAAIHLNRDHPDLDAARLAIDAMGGALESCKGRLGEPEPTLVEARSQLQLAFVNVANWVRGQSSSD
jgi:hypothetical protein